MSTSDPPDRSSSSRPVKRTKISHACSGCQKRRSKCELIDQEGCHRCKSLKTECSFKVERLDVGELRSNNPEQSFAMGHRRRSDFGGEEVGRVEMMQERLDELEGMVQDLSRGYTPRDYSNSHSPRNASSSAHIQYHVPFPSQPIASSSRHPTPPTYSQSRQQPSFPFSSHNRPYDLPTNSPSSTSIRSQIDLDRDESWLNGSADPDSFGDLYHRMRAGGEAGLMDPIGERGVMSEREGEMAYQSFKYHASSVFPHHTFLHIASHLPTHPFLRSAFLTYLTRCPDSSRTFTPNQITRLDDVLSINLSAYIHSCRPSREAILGLYVLSQLPGGPTIEARVAGNSARMIRMAYGMACEMGWDGKVEWWYRSLSNGLGEREIGGEIMEDVRLFCAVVLRLAWFQMHTTPVPTLPSCFPPSLPFLITHLHQSLTRTELDIQLFYEYRSLEIQMEFRKSLLLEELEMMGNAWGSVEESLKAMLSAVEKASAKTRELRSILGADIAPITSRSTLLAWLSYLDFTTILQTMFSARRNPLPLMINAVIQIWYQVSGSLLFAANRLSQYCLEEKWNLATLPQAIANAVIQSDTVLLNAAQHVRHHHRDRRTDRDAWMKQSEKRHSLLVEMANEAGGNIKARMEKAQESLAQLLAILQQQPREIDISPSYNDDGVEYDPSRAEQGVQQGSGNGVGDVFQSVGGEGSQGDIFAGLDFAQLLAGMDVEPW